MTEHLPASYPSSGPMKGRDDPSLPPSTEWEGYEEVGTFDLLEVASTLRRNLWLIGVAGIVGLGIGIYVASQQDPRYRATAVVQLTNVEQAFIEGLARLPQGGLEGDPIASQLHILRSQAVLAPVADSLGLRLRPTGPDDPMPAHLLEVAWMEPDLPVGDTLRASFETARVVARFADAEVQGAYGELLTLPGMGIRILESPGVSTASWTVRSLREATAFISASLDASRRPQTAIVDVSYTAPDPREAARVVNTVLRAFQNHDATMARQQFVRRQRFVEEQLSLADSLLEQAHRALGEFHRRERLESVEARISAFESQRVTLDMRRAELDADRALYSALLEQLQAAQEPGVSRELEVLATAPALLSNPIVGGQFSQLVEFDRERRMLTTGDWARSPSDPDVVQLDSLMALTHRHLIRAVDSYITGLDAMDARLVRLDSLATAGVARIEPRSDLAIEEYRLTQQVQLLGDQLRRLREERQSLSMAEAVEVGQVQVVELADPPSSPLAADRARTVVLALGLGLFFGIAGAFLREGLNTRIRDDVESVLGLHRVGVIPQLRVNGNGLGALTSGGVRALLRRTGMERAARAVPQGESELITLSDDWGAQAEAFRAIRTNLLFSDAARSLSTLVVTSAIPFEGKTTTAANLAVAYAQQGMRVLVVGCDLRRARLHKFFRVRRTPGLTDLLLGRATWEEVCHQASVDGLHVLAAGALPPNPSELLGGARMRKALEMFSEHYDLVIFDSSPLVAGPDAAILGSLCDGVLLVVRAGHTEREAAQLAVRQLHMVGARVLGAVVNDPDGELVKYSSYYQYAYEYTQQYSDREEV